jgi:hypothetical protein
MFVIQDLRFAMKSRNWRRLFEQPLVTEGGLHPFRNEVVGNPDGATKHHLDKVCDKCLVGICQGGNLGSQNVVRDMVE